MAVDVVEAELAQPPELGLDIKQDVRAVLGLSCVADRGKEGVMETVGGGGDMLQVQENAARSEQCQHLPVELPFCARSNSGG